MLVRSIACGVGASHAVGHALGAHSGVPPRLRDVGIGRADLPIIAQKVMGDHSIAGNVRRPHESEDLMEILKLA
jgi:alcohol dehydrogenase class IV